VIIGIVGYEALTVDEATAAQFLLDSIIGRYSHTGDTIVSNGRDGVEAMAERMARRWKWKNERVARIRPVKNSKWSLSITGRKAIDEDIAKACDILVSIEPRNAPGNFAVRKAQRLGKVCWELYL
jgi:hypothetical protein